MRVLVACEWSNTVRDAFLRRGHDAYSCDLERAEHPNPNYHRHIQGDVRPLLRERWDLVIAHPPCTYLCNSGMRWLGERRERYRLMLEACKFFIECLLANAPMVCVENPIQHVYARRFLPPHDQVVSPNDFGHRESKTTWLWLQGLPPLEPTEVVKPAERDCHGMQRWYYPHGKQRLRTFEGIARAMAQQWG